MSVALEESFKTYIAQKLPDVNIRSVQAVIDLNADGATVPFIARYRKERTGNLDEVQVRAVLDQFELYNEIMKRKDFVLKEIDKQGNLTDEIKVRLEKTMDLAEVEEIYRPYKRKKKTKATLAREAGIQPLADWLWNLGHGEVDDSTTLEVKAKEFIAPTKGYATYEEVLRGAQHILVEKISNNPDLRQVVRDEYFKNGRLSSTKTTKFKPHSKYEMYAEFSEPVQSLMNRKATHRYMALRRGWQEGELKVTIEGNDEDLLGHFEAFALTKPESQAAGFLKNCAKVALTVHVIPSITNELHRHLKELGDEHAIDVFAENVRRVLMSSPFGSKVVLGIDPGLKTGCKLALVDQSGNFVSHTVLYLTGQEAKDKAKKLFDEVFKQIKIEAVAVGNGTGGRETEIFVRETLSELGLEVPVTMVNESGASVYSASDIAREEFPDLDLTVRGAISIARRLQDPLAELVKIEPKSIGVGQYQHDVNQSHLKKSLHAVVESCVNQVGVDLNTASSSLLQYVSGIGPAIAKNIIQFRRENGLFKERAELLKVPQFSSKVFEQAAGFLRIPNGTIPLDRTGIHPESYAAVKDLAKEIGYSLPQLIGPDGAKKVAEQREKWAQLMGEFTFDDIVKELEKPGRDPRDSFKIFQFREDIHEVKDLKEGMICPGVVTNVTNFGAFVDIGVHQDGLVHISELSNKFVDDPRKVVSPGDQVKVKVLGVDVDKNQVSLSMKFDAKPQQRPTKGAGKPAAAKGKRPGGGKGKGRKPGGRPQKGGGGPRPRKPAQPFNNPFAALGNAKDG